MIISVRKFIRKIPYDYIQRSSLEERREKGFLWDIMGYLYPFSLGDPPISHLEISGHSFILFPSGSSIGAFHLLRSRLCHDPDISLTDTRLLLDATNVVEKDVPQLFSLLRSICAVRGHRLHAYRWITCTSIVSILQLARRREMDNSLGSYLKDLGLKRRGIQVFHELGLTDSGHVCVEKTGSGRITWMIIGPDSTGLGVRHHT
jgi:hypothetical protein